MEISSHPAWVCGLKLGKNLFLTNDKRSHPAWVCGLKHIEQGSTGWRNMSHPAWVCGLKQGVNMECDGEPGSHPAWVCGLKLTCTPVWVLNGRHTLRGCVD